MQILIKTKLWLGAMISALFLLAIAAMSIFTLQHSTDLLEEVYARRVLPVTYLEQMDAELKAARYRTAMVLLDKITDLG